MQLEKLNNGFYTSVLYNGMHISAKELWRWIVDNIKLLNKNNIDVHISQGSIRDCDGLRILDMYKVYYFHCYGENDSPHVLVEAILKIYLWNIQNYWS